MIAVRFVNAVVFTETLVLFIVVVVIGIAGPLFLAFNTKMVTGFNRKYAFPAAAFNHSLGQGNACRYFVKLHFPDGCLFVLFYVFNVVGVGEFLG
jgi:hypothetical protein